MKKTKFILIISCILILAIGSCLTVCAEETYTYEVIYSQSNVAYPLCIKFTSYYNNCAMVLINGTYNCYYYDGKEAHHCTLSDGLIGECETYKISSNGSMSLYYTGSAIGVSSSTLSSTFTGISTYDSLESYIASFDELETEEPTTETSEEPITETPEEPTTETPEEPTTEEPTTPISPTTPTTPTIPDTDNTDAGIASEFIIKLIGTEETFTPQNVIAIFVICLILECISHIASSLLNVTGGLK